MNYAHWVVFKEWQLVCLEVKITKGTLFSVTVTLGVCDEMSLCLLRK